MRTVTRGNNQAVTDLLVKRQAAVKELKQHLLKAQARMKRFSDLKRTERHFSVGDWIFLKLQLYRQLSIKGKKGNQKLNPKFYGSFEVLSKVGKVAYYLNLPPGSLIHPIFHVSQLKKKVGASAKVLTKLPLIGSEGNVHITPIAILDRRVLKKNNQLAIDVLV
jgi:hypothetical protein